MRTVSFVEHLEFDCKGSISSKAIEIADVDNDKVYQPLQLIGQTVVAIWPLTREI